MSRAVSRRRSAIRNATSESWRISLSVSWLTFARAYRAAGGRRVSALACDTAPQAKAREGLRGDLRALEGLVARAVVALGERSPLARLALRRRRPAARDAAVEGALLDLLLDEGARGGHSLRHRPRDLRLDRDREVAANVLEEGTVRLREVVRVGGETLHRPLARGEHLTPVLELRLSVDVRVDQILDRAIDRSRVLIHAVLDL